MYNTEKLAWAIRNHSLDMTSRGKSSHIGSCLSIADIMAVLYGEIMELRPKEPKWARRDRFILSKGHAGATVYATLAEVGFFSPEKLKSHYQDGSDLSGHVSHKRVPGVEFSTGSLGHGLPVATGIAKAGMLSGNHFRVFCLLSDGECDEGSNWEAILFAAHHKLENLTAIVDYNKIQSLAAVSATLGLEPFRQKWESFGWQVIEVDGHDHHALKRALGKRKQSEEKPLCIIAHTTKGKGVSFMEDQVLWHYRTAQDEEYAAAKLELNGSETS
jgi:transketolase